MGEEDRVTPDRRLAVTLANLSSKAKDATILADAPQTKAGLDVAKSAALIAQLTAAQKAVAAKPNWRR